MLPNETFLQITNCDDDIAFGGNILVELIDLCQNVVQTLVVNENFFYNEFTDIKGTKQIAFEFGNIGNDYYQEILFLKLSQPGISDNIWYSAGFLVTEDLKEETTLLEYKSEMYFRGISYDKQNLFQRIRLTCFKTDIDPQPEAEELTQISGNRYALRAITTPMNKYLFYTCDFFTYMRVLELLSHPIVYINGQRHNTTPTNLTKGERTPDTNFFDANFDANPTEEYLNIGYQIYQYLDVVSKIPDGEYYLENYNIVTSDSTVFTLSFDKPFQIAPDISVKIYKGDVLFANLDSSFFSMDGQNLIIDVSANPITESGIYDMVIQPNKVYHNVEYWQGFDFGEWEFEILEGDYDLTEYDENDYL